MIVMTTTVSNTVLAFIGPIGPLELVILALLGVLIFGKRLPEVGRNIGKGIIEFKKGLAGIDDVADKPAEQPPQLEDKQEDTTKPTDTEETPAG